MNAKQLEIRLNRDDGTIWATRRLNGKVTRIKDITKDVMFALCVDVSDGSPHTKAERSIRFSDNMECKITVELVNGSDSQPSGS